MEVMKSGLVILAFLLLLCAPTAVPAGELALTITEREIVERLTRLEEGQRRIEDSLRAEIRANTDAVNQLREDMKLQNQQLREDMREQNRQLRDDVNAQIKQLREDMKLQNQQLREDVTVQIKQLREDVTVQIKQLREDMREQNRQLRADMHIWFASLMGAYAVIVAATIGFALWDRRTMIRPFETKVRAIEEEIGHNRQRLHALLEALRTVSQTDEQLAEVLRRFHLL